MKAFGAHLLKPESTMHQHFVFSMIRGFGPLGTRACGSWSQSTADYGKELGRAAMNGLLRKALDRYLSGNKTTQQGPIDIEFISPKSLGMKKWAAFHKPFSSFITEIENSGSGDVSDHDFNKVELSYFPSDVNGAAPSLKRGKPFTIHTDEDFHAYLNLPKRPSLRAWIPRKSRFARAKESLSKVTAPFLNRLAKLPVNNDTPTEVSDTVAKTDFSEYDKKTLLLEEKGISVKEWKEFVDDFKEDEELPDKVAAQMKRAARTEGSERARFGLRMKDNKCEGAFMQRLSVQKNGDKLTYQLAYYSVAFAFKDQQKCLTNADIQLIETHTRASADIFFRKEAEQKLISGSDVVDEKK